MMKTYADCCDGLYTTRCLEEKEGNFDLSKTS